MTDENVAEYVSKDVFFPQSGTPIVVFEFWRRSGELVRQCVPAADEYNLDRLRDYDGWREVGVGKLFGFTGALGRFGHKRYWIEWEREAETPRFPYGLRWKLSDLWYRIRVLWWTIRHDDIREALRLISRGYLKRKVEVVFARE